MYEYIKGTVAEVAPAYAVIDVGGVGYYLHISLETYSAIEHETETRLYVHYVVREDAQLLYGFSTKAERELFRLLISVSGVGGNTARMILSTYSPRELQGIITAGNAVLLKNVKGLGLKTAQKIIVELSGKLMAPGADAPKPGRPPRRSWIPTETKKVCCLLRTMPPTPAWSRKSPTWARRSPAWNVRRRLRRN